MRNFDDLSEREMLALAISNEEEDSRIYADFADGLLENYPASAEVFTEMAAEENEHRRRLIDLFVSEVRRAHPAHPPPGHPRLHPAEADLAGAAAQHRARCARTPATWSARRRGSTGRR